MTQQTVRDTKAGAPAELRTRTVVADGLRFHVAEVGAGPPVLLLHGFPEYSGGWAHIMRRLAAAGRQAIACDLPGFHRSQAPSGGVKAYRVPTLARHLAALIDALALPPVTLVGHDWGGILGWWVAQLAGPQVARYVALNAPEPSYAIRRGILRPRQVLKSTYVALFQLPWLPEWTLSRPGAIRGALRLYLRNGPPVDEALLARTEQALLWPGSLRPAINYYRALLRYPPPLIEALSQPVTVIWGDADAAIDFEATMGDLPRFAPKARVHRLGGVGHFVQHEAPDAVLAEILRALG